MDNQRTDINVLGSALIIILIFCAAVALVANIALESSILQLKMLNNFKMNLNARLIAESEITKLERQLENSLLTHLPPNISFRQFVPDTLRFGEKQGANFYRISVENKDRSSRVKIVSTVAIRSQLNVNRLNETLSQNFFYNVPEKCSSTNSQVVQFSNGQLGAIIACTSSILIIHIESGQKIKEFPLSIQKAIDAKIAFTAIDSQSRNWCDFIFVNDGNGHLLKIDLQNTNPQQWEIVYNYPINMAFGQPIVGRHPKGEGILVYFLVDKFNNGRRELHALWDHSSRWPSLFFNIAEDASIDQFLLRQGYLVLSTFDDQSGSIKIYDAFNGKFIRQKFIKTGTHHDQEDSNQSIEIVMSKPRERESLVVVRNPEGKGLCMLEIEYSRLGRRTWEEYH